MSVQPALDSKHLLNIDLLLAQAPNDKLIVETDPISKPRMTQSDRWKQRKCVLTYRNYCDILRAEAISQNFSLSDRYLAIFLLAMPSSWSKKKKNQMLGKPHTNKPDGDNLIKSVQDALLPKDQTVWLFVMKKLWNTNGMVVLINL